MTPVVDVVMRCRDEMPYTTRALDALAAQRGVRARVLFFDCGSRDGSREAAVERGVEIVDVDPATYRPGRVLNQGMEAATTAIVAFVNADAIARSPEALSRLIEPFAADERVAAVFGRQRARAEARASTRRDYERAFGPQGAVATGRGAFFSMAASAVRRSAWRALPFDEAMRYSEDVDWSQRLGSLGFRSVYAPGAEFEHSHDYSLGAHFKRRRGEGCADGAIFRLGAPSPWRDLLRPLAGGVARDLRALDPSALPERVAQALGGFVGRIDAARAGTAAAERPRP